MNRIVIIRISGKQGLTHEIKNTFKLLRLYNKYTCSVIPNTPQYLGMIKRIKDFTTWGDIDTETFKLLLEKRGKIVGSKPLTEEYLKEKIKLPFGDFAEQFIQGKKEFKDVPGLKPFFKLCPPIGGFERKGTKKPFSIGGVLGYRKEQINKLIKKMI